MDEDLGKAQLNLGELRLALSHGLKKGFPKLWCYVHCHVCDSKNKLIKLVSNLKIQ